MPMTRSVMVASKRDAVKAVCLGVVSRPAIAGGRRSPTRSPADRLVNSRETRVDWNYLGRQLTLRALVGYDGPPNLLPLDAGAILGARRSSRRPSGPFATSSARPVPITLTATVGPILHDDNHHLSTLGSVLHCGRTAERSRSRPTAQITRRSPCSVDGGTAGCVACSVREAHPVLVDDPACRHRRRPD
jgi:hypothetical protein